MKQLVYQVFYTRLKVSFYLWFVLKHCAVNLKLFFFWENIEILYLLINTLSGWKKSLQNVWRRVITHSWKNFSIK